MGLAVERTAKRMITEVVNVAENSTRSWMQDIYAGVMPESEPITQESIWDDVSPLKPMGTFPALKGAF